MEEEDWRLYRGKKCLLTSGTFFPHRKEWRRRLHLHASIFVGIEIFPPKAPMHNYVTFERKPWSKSKRPYCNLHGLITNNDLRSPYGVRQGVWK